MDVRQLATSPSGIEETARRQGRLDILVNNAGISLPRTLLATSEAGLHGPLRDQCPFHVLRHEMGGRAHGPPGLRKRREHRFRLRHSRSGGAGGLLRNEGRRPPDHPCRRARARLFRRASQRRVTRRRRYTAAAECPLPGCPKSGRTDQRRWARACRLAALACQKTLPALSSTSPQTRRPGSPAPTLSSTGSSRSLTDLPMPLKEFSQRPRTSAVERCEQRKVV